MANHDASTSTTGPDRPELRHESPNAARTQPSVIGDNTFRTITIATADIEAGKHEVAVVAEETSRSDSQASSEQGSAHDTWHAVICLLRASRLTDPEPGARHSFALALCRAYWVCQAACRDNVQVVNDTTLMKSRCEAMVVALGSTVASLGILVGSNGAAVSSWSAPPSTYLGTIWQDKLYSVLDMG
jgi:hypothetical protein